MIESTEISLRAVRKKGLSSLYDLCQNHKDAGTFMPVSLVSESEFYNSFEQNGFWQNNCGRLIIEDKNQNLVGEIGCFKTSHYVDGRELYYRIFSGYRQKGYAKNALKLFVQFFFDSTSFNRLQAVTIDGNKISSLMLQKQGFSFEGGLRQARWFKGKLVGLEMYSLLRQEWLATLSHQ